MHKVLKLDSKKLSVSREDPDYISVKNRNATDKQDAPIGPEATDPANQRAGQSNNLSLSLQGGNGTRRHVQMVSGQKANEGRDVMRMVDKDKQINNLLSNTPNYNTYSLNNQRQ